ncbi:Hint domain-containing protein [Halocynthiibacter namhaensis]|uniref:Hint domain-containing protein n=1 Tax=Halocynthiibacter namhaensis TaxID=1290553 RepID=UPI00068C8A9F|nr:Hint domain-containing protein [Halocynthiibacter namhaensis]
MAIISGVVDFSKFFAIDPLTPSSFTGSGSNNLANLTGMTVVGTGFDLNATMDDANNNGQLNGNDSLNVTFPGDSSATTLNRINTNGISSSGSGFGAGADFAFWEASNGDMFILFSEDFDLSRISATGTLSLTESEAAGTMAVSDIICFADGTLINTPSGERSIETLKAGDLVSVRNQPAQRIQWIGCSTVNQAALHTNPKLRPIVISQCSLGNGLPLRDLRLSRQHRVVLGSAIARRMFGQDQIFVPAHQLTCIPGVFQDDSCEAVSYYHILLKEHELLTSAGLACESLYLGDQTLTALSSEARQEIATLFPKLQQHGLHKVGAAKVKKAQVQRFVHRSLANDKPMFDASVM